MLFVYIRIRNTATTMKLIFDHDRFSREIRVKRAILKISMDVAAEQIGISKTTLYRLENGHTPLIGTYAMVCTWLDVGMSFFILPEKKTKKTKGRKPSDQQLGA